MSTPPADAERSSADAGANGFALWIVGFALFFIAFACAAIVIGLHDVALANADLRLTVTSAALLSGGAASLVAAYQLVGLSRRARWAATIRRLRPVGFDRVFGRPARGHLCVPLRDPWSRGAAARSRLCRSDPDRGRRGRHRGVRRGSARDGSPGRGVGAWAHRRDRERVAVLVSKRIWPFAGRARRRAPGGSNSRDDAAKH